MLENIECHIFAASLIYFIAEYMTDGKILLLDSASYDWVRKCALHPGKQLKGSVVKAFLKEADRLYPAFRQQLHEGKYVKAEDYLLCLLIHLGFSLTDICNLTGISSSYLSKKRRRLLKMWYNVDEKPAEFDRRIKQLSP